MVPHRTHNHQTLTCISSQLGPLWGEGAERSHAEQGLKPARPHDDCISATD